ncbi:MAG: hypothetical protein H8E47_07820, partial [Anaerolineales bacterium]|nr:hypothetical protein [Anaerolineales bacterium]
MQIRLNPKIASALFVLFLLASCAKRQVGMATGTLTEGQQTHLSRTASSVGVAIATEGVVIWREAVAKATRDAVNAGATNVAEVIELVCKETQDEEELALKARLRFLDAFSQIGSQTARDHGVMDDELAEQMDAQTKHILQDALRRRFTERRDDL